MSANARAGRRAQNVACVLELYAAGVGARDIAQQLGLSVSTVRNYRRDPTGEQMAARKASYRRPCPLCGALMDGGNGRQGPRWCHNCARQAYADEQRPTRAELIERIQAWARWHGRPPAIPDWSKAHARQYLEEKNPTPSKRRELERALSDPTDYPSHVLIAQVFGSWEAAIEAAGLVPRYRRKHYDFDEYAATHQRVTDEELIAELRTLAVGNVAPAAGRVRAGLHTTGLNHFGSWEAFCTAAGLVSKHSLRRRTNGNHTG